MDVKFTLNDVSEGERAFAPEVSSEKTISKEEVVEDDSLVIDDQTLSDNISIPATEARVFNSDEYYRSRFPLFQKIPYTQFKKDCLKLMKDVTADDLCRIYDNIKVPTRGTPGSAGYDFKIPFNFKLYKNTSIVIPTGLRCIMPKNVVLLIVPRSGLGFKYRLSLMNTVGVIDSDYSDADNYGHIMIKIIHDGDEPGSIKITDSNEWDEVDAISRPESNIIDRDRPIEFKINQGFAQGIFLNYILTANEILDNQEKKMKKRTGGLGSTTD